MEDLARTATQGHQRLRRQRGDPPFVRPRAVPAIEDISNKTRRSPHTGSVVDPSWFVHRYFVLVQIVKQEWPTQWPNFVSEIVASAQSSETLCENNLIILRMLRLRPCF